MRSWSCSGGPSRWFPSTWVCSRRLGWCASAGKAASGCTGSIWKNSSLFMIGLRLLNATGAKATTASMKFCRIFKKRRNEMSEKKNKTIITAEPGKQELFVTREFDAPRELVFKAHTDPDIYVRWLGPRGLTMTLETFEPFS